MGGGKGCRLGSGGRLKWRSTTAAEAPEQSCRRGAEVGGLSAIEAGRDQLDAIGASVGTHIELHVTLGAVDADATFGWLGKRLGLECAPKHGRCRLSRARSSSGDRRRGRSRRHRTIGVRRAIRVCADRRSARRRTDGSRNAGTRRAGHDRGGRLSGSGRAPVHDRPVMRPSPRQHGKP